MDDRLDCRHVFRSKPANYEFISHGLTLTVAGFGSQLQTVRIEQEIQHVDGQDSVLVTPDRRVVARDDNLLERVAHVFERAYLFRPLLLVGYGERRLDVVPSASEVRHEVNLDLLVVGFRVPQVNHADVNVVTAYPELVVDDVLHQVRLLELPEIQQRIAKPDILEVELGLPAYVFPPLDVIPPRLAEQKCLGKIPTVTPQRNPGDSDAAFGAEGVRQPLGAGQRPDGGRDDLQQLAQFVQMLFQAVPLRDVGDVCLLEQGFQVGGLVLVAFHGERQGKPAIQQVVAPGALGRSVAPSEVLGERQGEDMHLVPAPAELRQHVGCEETGIAPGHVDVHIVKMEVVIQDGLEILQELHLVKKQVVHSAVPQAGVYVFADGLGLPQMDVAQPVELDLDDVVGWDALRQEMLLEQFEEKIGFPAPPHSRDDLNEMVSRAVLQPREVEFPWYFHRTSLF